MCLTSLRQGMIIDTIMEPLHIVRDTFNNECHHGLHAIPNKSFFIEDRNGYINFHCIELTCF